MSLDFKMYNKPLQHPVFCGKTCVIPAGAKGVEIAYRQSHLTRYDKVLRRNVRLNVYRYNGKIYHV